jgi:hypothetical protein
MIGKESPKHVDMFLPLKDGEQTALFKGPVRTAL